MHDLLSVMMVGGGSLSYDVFSRELRLESIHRILDSIKLCADAPWV